MKTGVLKLSVLLILILSAKNLSSQDLNIGNLTSVRASDGIIYVAGQKGIAAVKASDMSLLWEVTMPETTYRLINNSKKGIAFSSYLYEGKKGQLLSAFASLWDKVFKITSEFKTLDSGNWRKFCSGRK
jgi:hypothetical protein